MYFRNIYKYQCLSKQILVLSLFIFQFQNFSFWLKKVKLVVIEIASYVIITHVSFSKTNLYLLPVLLNFIFINVISLIMI